jgi:selenoprotein W-related protein
LQQEGGSGADEVALVKGDRGVFDIRADGELIFSKKTAGRFPTHAEIIALVRRQAKPPD